MTKEIVCSHCGSNKFELFSKSKENKPYIKWGNGLAMCLACEEHFLIPEQDIVLLIALQEHSGTVVTDRLCHCGYNLKSLKTDGRCPECGSTIGPLSLRQFRRHSFRRDTWSHFDLYWLLGAALFIIIQVFLPQYRTNSLALAVFSWFCIGYGIRGLLNRKISIWPGRGNPASGSIATLVSIIYILVGSAFALAILLI